MKLNRWLGLGLVIVLACGFLYWLAGTRAPTSVFEPTPPFLDPGDSASPPALLKPGVEPERSQEQNAVSETKMNPRESAAIPGRKGELAPETSVSGTSTAEAVEESVEERRFREAEERRIARKEALEAIEAAVIPLGQSGPIDLQTVFVPPGGGESEMPDMPDTPQRVEPEEPPAEIVEALGQDPLVDLDMERAFKEAREGGASPELKRYMESGGELGESGELPPELR